MLLPSKCQRLDINISFSIQMEALPKKNLYYVENFDDFLLFYGIIIGTELWAICRLYKLVKNLIG